MSAPHTLDPAVQPGRSRNRPASHAAESPGHAAHSTAIAQIARFSGTCPAASRIPPHLPASRHMSAATADFASCGGLWPQHVVNSRNARTDLASRLGARAADRPLRSSRIATTSRILQLPPLRECGCTPMRAGLKYIFPPKGTVMLFIQSHNGSQHLRSLGADLRLRLTRGVLMPLLLCWWADVGAECFIRMSE